MSEEFSRENRNPNKRSKPRSTGLPSPMVEIKFPGVPLYQLKIHDTGDGGIGVIVRSDSDFLNHIDIGQELEVGIIAPTEDYQKPSGHYLSRIEHITEIQEGPLSGHILVGLAFLNQIPAE